MSDQAKPKKTGRPAKAPGEKLIPVPVRLTPAQREKLQRQTEAQARRVAEAQENERLAALRLEVGAIGRHDWLQARVALLEAKQSLVQLQLQAWLNHAALYRALGGAQG